MLLQFATGSYKSSSLPVSAQRVVNMYAEKQPPDAETSVAVFGCPGLVLFATVGSGPIRGFCAMAGLLYVVSGGTFYSVTSLGVVTTLGGTISGLGPVAMDTNGTQVVITNGVNGYVYSATAGFQLITDVDFNPANTVTFFDQRFLFDKVSSNQFFASDILDGSSYDPLVIASAETRPDFVKAVVLVGQVLMVFGEKTIEPWQDVGAPNFPFQIVPGTVIERGLLAPYATAKADNTVFFMGENRVLYRLAGLTPQRVSNHAIEEEWQKYAVVSDAFMFAYQLNGHEFVNVTFPSQPSTWVFDVSSGIPHERESWDANNNNYGRWRGNCTVSIYNKVLIGDAYDGSVGYLDNLTFTEYGNVMQGSCTSPHTHEDRKRLFVNRFELEVESGVGLATGQGMHPQVMLEISKDGGRTFGSLQRWRSMGALGSYLRRLIWFRLGKAYDWVFRITISDPVKRTIMAAHAEVDEGV